jgi:hypothetical protein
MPAAAGDIDQLRKYHAELGAVLARIDPDRSPFEKTSYHVRRHFPLYALAAIFALIIILIPSVNDRNAGENASDITPGDQASTDFDTGSGTTPGGSKGGSDVGGLGSGGPTAVSGPSAPPGVGKVVTATGTTIGGFECKAGVRQLPWSQYANPCVAKFTGNNGGKTYNGVDAKKIRIAIRKPAVDAGDATDAQARAQGAATRATGIAMLKKYSAYFAKTMELYGRQIEFVDFQSRSSNGIEEAQSRGEDGACADATDLKSQNIFGVVGYNGGLTETQPFADCASARGLYVPFGASYFPEQYYTQKWHPYVWHTLQECERIARDVGEYVGKRLLNRKAKWALDPLYQKQNRVFGTYVPDNDGYQRCVNISETTLKRDYGGTIKSRVNYQLDVSRFPDQAETAVVKFKSDGVTTLINACDTLSTRFLTEAADRQGWGPEWFIIGVATQDTDGAARTFAARIIDGHLFGMSQLGATRLIEGTAGEAYKTWKTAFPKEAPPAGFGAVYYRVLALHMQLQSAGPILTPHNIAKGLRAMPNGGGDTGAQGTWSFKGDHTAIDDSREIYWKESAKGFDGNAGGYLETYGGKRFSTGQWPRTEPPVYPK